MLKYQKIILKIFLLNKINLLCCFLFVLLYQDVFAETIIENVIDKTVNYLYDYNYQYHYEYEYARDNRAQGMINTFKELKNNFNSLKNKYQNLKNNANTYKDDFKYSIDNLQILENEKIPSEEGNATKNKNDIELINQNHSDAKLDWEDKIKNEVIEDINNWIKSYQEKNAEQWENLKQQAGTNKNLERIAWQIRNKRRYQTICKTNSTQPNNNLVFYDNFYQNIYKNKTGLTSYTISIEDTKEMRARNVIPIRLF